MATPVVLTTGARPIIPVESGGVPMTPVDTLGEPVTVVDTLGEPVVLINNDGTPAFLAYSAKTYLGGVAPYHWLDFINNRALYAGADVGNVTQATGYSFTRASTGYYTNSDGTLTNFASGALRRGDRGVLIEGARTNLATNSENINSYFDFAQNMSISVSSSLAPNGTATANRAVPQAGGEEKMRAKLGINYTAVPYTFSMFAKADGYDWISLGFYDGSVSHHTWFDVNAGTVGTNAAGNTATITALSNGWYRCSITRTLPSTVSGQTRLYVSNADNINSFNANGTSGIFIWGAQLEAASFASSYIPTVAAAATRAADSLVYTAGVTYPLQLWSEFERVVDTGGAEGIVQVDASARAQRAFMFVSSGDLLAIATRGGTDGGDANSASVVTVGAITKGAGRFAVDDVRLALAGTLSSADTVASVPTSAPDTLRLGDFGAAATYGFNYIRRIAVIQGAGTDAQLQSMTGS